MIPTRKFISQLIAERKRYAHAYGSDCARQVYNWLILHHIRGVKENRKTLKFLPCEYDEMLVQGLVKG